MSSGGQQPREHVKTPGNTAWIFELLTQRQRLQGLRARLVEIPPHDTQARRCGKEDAQASYFTSTPLNHYRFIIELLRSIVVAVQDGDGGQDKEGAAMLHLIAAYVGGFSRLQ